MTSACHEKEDNMLGFRQKCLTSRFRRRERELAPMLRSSPASDLER
jgi:hypothetical protein